MAIAMTRIVMKVFFRPAFAIHGVSAKMNAVLKVFLVRVTPTIASPTIYIHGYVRNRSCKEKG